MKEPKDKRTKEHKEWKKWKAEFDKENSIGLGDVMETVTKKLGIKKLVERFTPEGIDCGCKKRKDEWNSKYKIVLRRCFTEDLFNKWTDLREKRINKNWEGAKIEMLEQINVIIPTYEQLFALTFKPCGHCGKDLLSRIKQIDKIYDNYKQK